MPTTRPRHRLPTIIFVMLTCGGSFVTLPASHAEVFVDESPTKNNRPSAIASDLAPLPAEEIAREVLRLQAQMGGSLVRNRAGLQNWNNSPSPVTTRNAPAFPSRGELRNRSHLARDRQVDKVSELREAAWQLDTTAHRLEGLDLYDQADALRRVASRLRTDARTMKQAASSIAAE